MAHWINELEELCETVTESIAEANKKLRDDGALSRNDADYLDKLTHMIKSIKTTIAMEEHKDDYSYGDGYSGRYYDRDGVSNARRRDSRGRYTRNDGYSYGDDMEHLVKELRRIEGNAPDEKSRQEIHKLMRKFEDM